MADRNFQKQVEELRDYLRHPENIVDGHWPEARHHSALEAIFKEALRVSEGDVGRAFLVAGEAVKSGRQAGETEVQYHQRLDGIPSRAFGTTLPFAGVDKPQHFFAGAALSYYGVLSAPGFTGISSDLGRAWGQLEAGLLGRLYELNDIREALSGRKSGGYDRGDIHADDRGAQLGAALAPGGATTETLETPFETYLGPPAGAAESPPPAKPDANFQPGPDGDLSPIPIYQSPVSQGPGTDAGGGAETRTRHQGDEGGPTHPGPNDPTGSTRSIAVLVTDAQGNTAVVTEGAGGTTYTYPSGGYLHISADGTQTLVGPDSRVIASTQAGPYDPPGSTRSLAADGTVAVTDAMGNTAVVTEDAGGTTYTYPSGGSWHIGPAGAQTVTDLNGQVLGTTQRGPHDPEGSSRSLSPNGVATLTDAQGRTAVVIDGPDGTTYGYPSGSSLHFAPDGTETLTDPQGNSATVTHGADGSTTYTYPSGGSRAFGPDGTETLTAPDGGKVIHAPDGSVTITTPDGHSSTDQTITAPDGSRVTFMTNERGEITVVTDKPDHTTIVQTPDGDIFTNNPDGSYMRTHGDGTGYSVSTDASGGTTTTYFDAGGKAISDIRVDPDGGSVAHNADGSITVTEPDGTSSTDQTIIAEDGSRVTFMTNERGQTTVVTQRPDHTTIIQTPDGSTMTKNPDGSHIRTHPDGSGYTVSTDGGITTKLYFDKEGKQLLDVDRSPFVEFHPAVLVLQETENPSADVGGFTLEGQASAPSDMVLLPDSLPHDGSQPGDGYDVGGVVQDPSVYSDLVDYTSPSQAIDNVSTPNIGGSDQYTSAGDQIVPDPSNPDPDVMVVDPTDVQADQFVAGPGAAVDSNVVVDPSQVADDSVVLDPDQSQPSDAVVDPNKVMHPDVAAGPDTHSDFGA